MSSSKQTPSVCENTTEENANEEVLESVSMVLNLEELREMIVDLVLTHQYCSEKNRQDDIRSLRLLSKNWLLSVSKVLYRNGLPMIKFDFISARVTSPLDEEIKQELENIGKHFNPNGRNVPWHLPKLNDTDGADIVTQNPKTLENFVKEFGSVFSSTECNAPTYSLDIGTKFLKNGHFPILQSCLADCGKGLVKLKIEMSKECPPLPSSFPKVALPNLKKLRCTLEKIFYFQDDENQQEIGFINNAGILLKHLLEASTCLEEFSLYNPFDLDVLEFDNYVLPSTLKTLEIQLYNSKDIQILSRNQLPTLFDLKLEIQTTPVAIFNRLYQVLDMDSFYEMLNNWRKSLKKLHLGFNRLPGMPPIEIRFPVMENLRTLTFKGPDVELNQMDNILELCFPKVKSLDLSLTESVFQKWCQTSVFRLVENLTIKLFDDQHMKATTINLQNIQLTATAFPHVTSLGIEILGTETSVLRFIFKKMSQLTKLSIKAHGTKSLNSSNFWDALLIGTAAETVEKLKNGLDKPDCAEILENTSMPSIRLLKDLKTLSLFSSMGIFLEEGGQLISEVSFIHGFFKMPAFTTLKLGGRFKISYEMQESLKPKMGPDFRIV